MLEDVTSMTLQELKILVVGPSTWGKADTLDEALKKAQRPRHFTAYIVHPDTVVTQMGDLEYPIDYPPRQFYQRLLRKKKGGRS
jgi:hypothetical protein